MHVLDYIMDRLSNLFKFSNYPLGEKAYSVMFHTVGLSFRDLSERYCVTSLERCINKPMIIVDRGPWYRWALERLGLKYKYQRFSLRNTIERFYNNINTWKKQSIEDYASAIAIIRNILTIIMKT
jgi:transposase-like protein